MSSGLKIRELWCPWKIQGHDSGPQEVTCLQGCQKLHFACQLWSIFSSSQEIGAEKVVKSHPYLAGERAVMINHFCYGLRSVLSHQHLLAALPCRAGWQQAGQGLAMVWANHPLGLWTCTYSVAWFIIALEIFMCSESPSLSFFFFHCISKWCPHEKKFVTEILSASKRLPSLFLYMNRMALPAGRKPKFNPSSSLTNDSFFQVFQLQSLHSKEK